MSVNKKATKQNGFSKRNLEKAEKIAQDKITEEEKALLKAKGTMLALTNNLSYVKALNIANAKETAEHGETFFYNVVKPHDKDFNSSEQMRDYVDALQESLEGAKNVVEDLEKMIETFDVEATAKVINAELKLKEKK